MSNNNEFNDFFGFDSQNNEFYDEQIDNTEYVKQDKKWGAISIIAVALIIVMVLISSGKIAVGKSGIKLHGDNLIEGLTYTELSNMLFKVDNKNSKDVSIDTIWLLNDTEIARGTNSTRLDMSLIHWGMNELIAVNGDDNIKYRIDFQKFQTDKDKIHNMLSMMVSYPDECFVSGVEYKDAVPSVINDIAKLRYNAKTYSNGLIETTQSYGTTDLITIEDQALSLFIEAPLEVDKSFIESSAVTVGGNWDKVSSAELSFEQGDASLNCFKVLLYKNGESSIIDPSTYHTYNGKVLVPIKESGTYVVKSDPLIDYDKLYNNIRVCYFKLDSNLSNNTDTNDKLVDKPENSNIVTNNKPKYLDDFISKIKNISEIKNNNIQLNLRVSEYYDGILTIDDENIDISDCESFQDIFDIAISTDKLNTFTDNLVIIADFSNLNLQDTRSMLNVLNRAASKTNGSLVNIIAYGSSINGLSSITNIDKKIRIIEVESEQDILDDYIISVLSLDKIPGLAKTITYNGTEYNVVSIVDSGFSISNNGYNKECSFNNTLKGSNSFGQCLLSKLIYTHLFTKDMVSTSECLYDRAILNNPDYGFDGSAYQQYAILKDSDIENMMQNGINYADSDLSVPISMLSISQLDNFLNNFIELSGFEAKNSTDVIQLMYNELYQNNPILGIVKNTYGSSTILITAIDKSIDEQGTYFIHFYDPMNQTEDCIGKLNIFVGVNNNSIGFGYNFEYMYDGLKYTDLAIVKNITIYNSEVRYQEKFNG